MEECIVEVEAEFDDDRFHNILEYTLEVILYSIHTDVKQDSIYSTEADLIYAKGRPN